MVDLSKKECRYLYLIVAKKDSPFHEIEKFVSWMKDVNKEDEFYDFVSVKYISRVHRLKHG